MSVDKIVKILFQNQDLKYRDFHSSLVPNVEKEIVICRRLSDEAFHSNELTAVINKPIKKLCELKSGMHS